MDSRILAEFLTLFVQIRYMVFRCFPFLEPLFILNQLVFLCTGTPFIRQLLLHETEIIYECRACRALFRGLLNFVDHKKNYCTMRVGVENAIAAQSAPTGLQRWACQDKEPIPVIEPEAPEEEAAHTNIKSNKKVPINVKPKQQMVIRKPDATYILVRPIAGKH